MSQFVLKVVTVHLPRVNSEYQHRLYSTHLEFYNHCSYHILNMYDIWTDVLDECLVQTTRAIFYQKSTSDVVSNMKSGGVLWKLYEKVCDIIIQHVSKCIEIPLFAVSEKGTRQFWLTMDGMIVISREGVIRTAFFPSDRTDAKQIRFQKAWLYAVRKMIEARSECRESIIVVTENNWRKPPGYAEHVSDYMDLLDYATEER